MKLKDLVNNDKVVVYIETKKQWQKLKDTGLFNMCNFWPSSRKKNYSLTRGTWDYFVSKTDAGSYKQSGADTVIFFNEIDFEEFPEQWYIQYTEETFDIFEKWRNSVRTYRDMIDRYLDKILLSKHTVDRSFYCATRWFNNNIDKFSNYKRITIEQFIKNVYIPKFGEDETLKEYYNKTNPKQMLPTENFGIVIENENGKDILNWFEKRGYDINDYTGEGFDSRIYWVKSDEIVQYSGRVKPDSEIQIYKLQELIDMEKQTTRKIIGYKAPMDLGGHSVKGLTFKKTSSYFGVWYECKYDGDNKIVLPAEIVETWEAVYEEKFKVGDYVILNVPANATHWAAGQKDLFGKIVQPKKAYYGGKMFVIATNEKVEGGCQDEFMRKATPEEIQAYSSKDFTLGAPNSFIVNVKPQGIYQGSENITNYVKEMVDFYSNVPTKFGSYDAKVSEITFEKTGCKSAKSTYANWLEIWNYYQQVKD